MGRRPAVVTTALLLATLLAPGANGLTSPTPVPKHPSVASTPASGQYIKDLAVKDGLLYIGHGNYSVNTGPTDVAWLDLSTLATGVDTTAPTEEINTYRSIGGDLYVPWIDPTLCGSCHPNGSGGFTTSSGGWHHTYVFPAAHVFDIAKYGSDWFLAGAGGETAGAVIYRSTDGGATWRLSLAQASAGGITGWERFYWLGQAGGRMFAQAAHTNGPSADTFPLRVWDGTRWARAKGRATLGLITEASNVESFAGRIWTSRGQVFDGRRVTSMGAPFGIADFFQTPSYLYIVSPTGQVARTTGSGWTVLPGLGVPTGKTARSIATLGGWFYVGTTDGMVYRS